MTDEYYYQQELIDLGFTKKEINTNWPIPDLTYPNPYDKKKNIKKYLKEKVKHLLTDELLRQRKEKREKRSDSAIKGRAKRISNLLKKAEGFNIILHKRDDIEQLKEEAVWNDYEYKNRKYELKHTQLDKYYYPPDWFIEQCSFYYILYNESNFKDLLKRIKGKPGAYPAEKIIRRKFYSQIGERYPFLEEKCSELLAKLDFEEMEYWTENENDPISNPDQLRLALLNLGDLSTSVLTKRRKEQSILKRYLIGGRSEYSCCFCGEVFDVQDSRCAHIKHHSECNEDEMVDPNNVLLACPICDYYFENGFFGVEKGVIIPTTVKMPKPYSSNINLIIGKKCHAFNNNRVKYFNWHLEFHIIKLK